MRVLKKTKRVIIKIDDSLEEIKKEIKADLSKVERFVRKAVSKVSRSLGSTTKDDVMLTTLISTAVNAGVLSLSNGSVSITTEQVSRILEPVWSEINKRQIERADRIDKGLRNK